MSLLKKKNDNTEPQFSFGESILVLVGILCILGYLIIVKKQEPQAPLFISFMVLALYGHLRGFKWQTVMDGMREGLRTGVDPLVISCQLGS